ncbi:MAG: lipid-transfer protein [Gammaproteobacteria bacterium]
MDEATIRDRAAIVGIGETAFGKGLAESEEHLACRAIQAALDDAGIDPAEVDGLFSYSMQGANEDEIARNLGLGDLTAFARTPAGGGGGCGTVGLAAMAVATGQARVAVAYRARKRSAKASRPWAQTQAGVTRWEMWTRPWGVLRPADEVAVIWRRYMHEYGATRAALAEIALTQRANANRNPAAAMRDRTLTLDEYMSARWISEPLCLFDCCLETDGALAAVLVPAPRARDCRNTPAFVHAFAQGVSRGSGMMFGVFGEDPLRTPSHAAAARLWANSDLQPADIDVAQIYDAFTPEVLFCLEGYGFCARGEAADFVAGGALRIGGRLPANTAGGSLSEAYLHGFNLVTEAVKQIRGSAANPVAGVRSAFVCSSDGVPTSALVLRR